MTDDPHDGMPYTAAQEARATAEAVERRLTNRNPERALSGPEKPSSGLFGWLVLGALVAVALAWFALPAFPQSACAERGVIVKRLAEKYGEEMKWQGVASSGAMLEIWAAPDGSTWTALFSTPDGQSCIGAVGEGWQGFASPVAGVPA